MSNKKHSARTILSLLFEPKHEAKLYIFEECSRTFRSPSPLGRIKGSQNLWRPNNGAPIVVDIFFWYSRCSFYCTTLLHLFCPRGGEITVKTVHPVPFHFERGNENEIKFVFVWPWTPGDRMRASGGPEWGSWAGRGGTRLQ